MAPIKCRYCGSFFKNYKAVIAHTRFCPVKHDKASIRYIRAIALALQIVAKKKDFSSLDKKTILELKALLKEIVNKNEKEEYEPLTWLLDLIRKNAPWLLDS